MSALQQYVQHRQSGHLDPDLHRACLEEVITAGVPAAQAEEVLWAIVRPALAGVDPATLRIAAELAAPRIMTTAEAMDDLLTEIIGLFRPLFRSRRRNEQFQMEQGDVDALWRIWRRAGAKRITDALMVMNVKGRR